MKCYRRPALLILLAPWLLAGCGTAPPSDSTVQAAAPTFQVGDRWTYQARDGFRLPLEWIETREVVAIGAEGITVRVTQKGDKIDSVRTELWMAPGQVRVGALRNDETRRFATPLQRYNFPLTPGQSWNQWVDNDNETAGTQGQINRRSCRRVGDGQCARWSVRRDPVAGGRSLR